MAVLRRFERGELIFRQADPCPGVFIVGTGQVRVFLVAPSGKQHVLHLVQPGQTFAEVAAIGGFDCPASAEAAGTSTCVLLPREPFQQALRDDHSLCLQLLASFSLWVRHFLGLVEDITLRDASGRVARYVLENTGESSTLARLPVMKKDIASTLNLTSETLSRTLRRLSDAGLIVTEGSEIVLRDREQLQRMADGLTPEL